jgi:hypothetical protein
MIYLFFEKQLSIVDFEVSHDVMDQQCDPLFFQNKLGHLYYTICISCNSLLHHILHQHITYVRLQIHIKTYGN